MKELDADSLPDLLNKIISGIEDQTNFYVWRGQSSAKWKPLPSLYRRLLNNGYKENELDEKLVREYEEDLFCEANSLGYYGEAGGNRLGLMAAMQHYGGATRLLDVSLDPFIALWFASSNSGDNGCVLRYDVNPSCHARAENIMTWSNIVDDRLRGKPVLYSPKRSNERIKAQSSAFLLTVLDGTLANGSVFTNGSEEISITEVVFPKSLKGAIRNYLQVTHGLREYEVFPDLEGFAYANSADARFQREHGCLYNSHESGGLFARPFNGYVK